MTDNLALLRLLQLVSPSLPVGAYAYSQGLEYALEAAWVQDESSARDWIFGVLQHGLTYLDVPVFARLHQAWASNNTDNVQYWNDYLFAARESAELQQEEQHLGRALARLLSNQGMVAAQPWQGADRVCFATLFTLAAVCWDISAPAAANGYLWSWTENQTMAATKLVPLGQTAAQRILSQAQPFIVAAVNEGLTLDDADITGALPGLALASALHETQYSRLFRS
ncbi:MAG: urease accessory UreF family protein [Gammaproteobacteria bacterium]